MIETLNGASVDVDALPFQWHIGGHASFQAIMHVLSELRNPEFDTPDRSRALRALQMSRILKENNNTKAWTVVKTMIEKAIHEQYSSPKPMENRSTSPDAPVPISGQKAHLDYNLPAYVGTIPAYALMPQTTAEPQPAQTTPEDYNDFNFNNLVGQDVPEVSVDFDWVS